MTEPITTYEQAQEALKPIAEWLRANPPAIAVSAALDDGYTVQALVMYTDRADALQQMGCWKHRARLTDCLTSPATRAEHADTLKDNPDWAAMTAPAG